MNLKQIAKCYQKSNVSDLSVMRYKDKNNILIIAVFYGNEENVNFYSSLGLSESFNIEMFIVSNNKYAPNLLSDVALDIKQSKIINKSYSNIMKNFFEDERANNLVVLRKNNNFFQGLDIDMVQIIELSLQASLLYNNLDENMFWHDYDNNCFNFSQLKKYPETKNKFISGILYDDSFSVKDLSKILSNNDINNTWLGSPILLLAAQAGRLDLLNYILEQTNLDVNVIDDYGNTIMHYLKNNEKLFSNDIFNKVKAHGFYMYSWKNIDNK